MSSGVSFVAPRDDMFRKILKQRVDAYFTTSGKSRYADWRMITKTVICLGSLFGGYAMLVSNQSFGATLLISAFIGLTLAAVGFNVGHDGCHGSYSQRAWVNQMMGNAFALIGAHPYNWRFIHNIIHHTFTNIPGRDGDLHVPVLRYSDDGTTPRWHHRFQHIYAYGIYSLASIAWVFYKDYVHMTKTSHMGYDKRPAPWSEYVMLGFTKLFHYVAFLLIPLAVLDRPFLQVAAAFVLMHLVAGTVLATVFAAAHLVDEVEQPKTDNQGVIAESWYAHQMRTTANFAMNNLLVTWFVGGLNFQIEHHLFPSISHVHYPALAPIVRATAEEFKLPYIVFPTFIGAQLAHMRFLRNRGVAPVSAPIPAT